MSTPVENPAESAFERVLREDGRLVYTVRGVSMLPLLRQKRDLVIIERRGPGRCAVGDVVLYQHDPGRFVLHRVVEVRPEDYIILGDNCVAREYGITDDEILGVMTACIRAGREYSARGRGMRLYTALTLRTERPRVALKKCVLRLKRAAKKAPGRG